MDIVTGGAAATGTVLVTGATGFVGAALCPALAASGLAIRRASRLPQDGHVAVGSIGGDTDWSAALDDCVAVVHLAGRAHDRGATPADFQSQNVDATLKLAEDAARAGVRRLVFVSTVKVHGEASPPGRGLIETDPFRPDGPYARSKAEAEQRMLEIAGRTGLEVVIIRPPLIHGPGAKANLRALLRPVDRGWPLPLGAVHNHRSLVGLRNLCSLIVLAIGHPAAAGEAFLAADGEPISTTDLLLRLARLMDRRPNLLPIPAGLVSTLFRLAGKAGTARSLLGDLVVDAGKARRLLGWEPPVSLDDGLAEMVAAYESR